MAQSSQTEVQPERERIMATPAFLYACVLVMGAVGASLRYAVDLLMPSGPIPFSTLTINLFGCYIIYVIYQWFGRRVHLPHAVIRGLGVGLVGAFTTLSAFSTESLGFLQSGSLGLFAVYLALTSAGTFAASLLGWATVAALERRRMRTLSERHARNARNHARRKESQDADRGNGE